MVPFLIKVSRLRKVVHSRLVRAGAETPHMLVFKICEIRQRVTKSDYLNDCQHFPQLPTGHFKLSHNFTVVHESNIYCSYGSYLKVHILHVPRDISVAQH